MLLERHTLLLAAQAQAWQLFTSYCYHKCTHFLGRKKASGTSLRRSLGAASQERPCVMCKPGSESCLVDLQQLAR